MNDMDCETPDHADMLWQDTRVDGHDYAMHLDMLGT